MTSFHALQGADVARWLDYPGCISAVRNAMVQFSASGIKQPLREIYRVGDESLFAMMPGIFDQSIGYGTKVISVYFDEELDKSIHSGVVVLFDRTSGKITHVADAHEVTKIRTGAASAVATDVLARKDASRLLLIGAGTQAESHLMAIKEVRDLEQVTVVGRNSERTAAFAHLMQQQTGISVQGISNDGDNVQQAATAADIICTLTTADKPVLLHEWVEPGTHVNVVGSSHDGPVEIDGALVKNSLFVVDSRASVLAAGAEFRRALEAGLVDENHIQAEIGELLASPETAKPAGGRAALCDQQSHLHSDPQSAITVYKSLGHISQDLAAVAYIKQRMESED